MYTHIQNIRKFIHKHMFTHTHTHTHTYRKLRKYVGLIKFFVQIREVHHYSYTTVKHCAHFRFVYWYLYQNVTISLFYAKFVFLCTSLYTAILNMCDLIINLLLYSNPIVCRKKTNIRHVPPAKKSSEKHWRGH